MSVWQLWWAVRTVGWLCLLPLRLHRYPLPVLLQRLTPMGRSNHCAPREMARVVRFVIRLCHLRLFRTRLFPRACLRQALALYYVLARLGYPVTIHFGVSKAGVTLHGHSWVTVEGAPVAERLPIERFRILYTYPHPHQACRGASRGLVQADGDGA